MKREGAARNPEAHSESDRTENQSARDSSPMVVTIETFKPSHITQLHADQPQRIDVVTDYTILPFLVVRRSNADQVLILNNGAVDHTQAKGRPVFQRSSWWQDLRHHQIYFCDPATLGPDMLSLGWGQINEQHWVVYDAIKAIRIICEGLGVDDPRSRSYFGSSAGGFMSLGMAALDDGAMAVVNNAQFDWTRWMPDAVNTLRHLRFGGITPIELRERHPERTNVLNLFTKKQAKLRVRYLVNLGSKHDRLVDYPMLHSFLTQWPDLVEDLNIKAYFDAPRGHNPLERKYTVDLLNWGILTI